MTLIKKIEYKLWLLWSNFNFKDAFKSTLSVFGVLWLLIEILIFFNEDEFSNSIQSSWWLFLIISIVIVVYEAWPKTTYSYHVKGKDVSITIQLGDIFKVSGALIIPINNRFDVSNKSVIQQSKSILRYFVQHHYKDEYSHLDFDIKTEIGNNYSWYDKFIISKNLDEYKVGTVVPIFRDEKQFYLLANSVLNKYSKSRCNKEDLMNSLNELWSYLTHCGSKDNLVIPIIGTGRGRINLKREEVIKEIVLSFLVSLSAETYCEQLIICVHPADVKKYKIDIKDLTDFVKLHCLNTNFQKINTKDNNNKGTSIN